VERVTGIGGLFFRARVPDALGRRYAEHLGVSLPPTTFDDPDWWQDEGPTVWGIFAADSTGFAPLDRDWMVSFRVRDLDAMVGQLVRAGATVDVDPETYPNGRFATTADPEGNPTQLRQPHAAAMARPVMVADRLRSPENDAEME
jgi:predicted enzyme related to lactoylglutathione lyase